MDQKKIRLLKNLSTGLVIATVVFAFLIAGIRIFGVQVYGVLTGSMEPTYPTGSLIYVKDVDTSELRVNDVITFSISPNVIATHRIVEIVPDENYPTILRYRTKGDANNDVDASLVSANNIIGKAMFAIPQLGYLASYIQEPPGIYVAILICGLMIAFVFYTDSLDSKQQKNEQTAPVQDKPRFDPVAWINQLSQKLLGKPLIKEKKAAEPTFQQGYAPQQTMQQPMQYAAPQQYPQPYPQQGQYQQYPQQNYPPQMYQQPYYGAPQYPQQGYQQQYPPQGYPQQTYAPQQEQQYQQVQQLQSQAYYPQQCYVQQGYGQQPYQQPYQQPSNMQQQYVVPQNAQQGYPVQAEQGASYPQARNRRTERM